MAQPTDPLTGGLRHAYLVNPSADAPVFLSSMPPDHPQAPAAHTPTAHCRSASQAHCADTYCRRIRVRQREYAAPGRTP